MKKLASKPNTKSHFFILRIYSPVFRKLKEIGVKRSKTEHRGGKYLVYILAEYVSLLFPNLLVI